MQRLKIREKEVNKLLQKQNKILDEVGYLLKAKWCQEYSRKRQKEAQTYIEVADVFLSALSAKHRRLFFHFSLAIYFNYH